MVGAAEIVATCPAPLFRIDNWVYRSCGLWATQGVEIVLARRAIGAVVARCAGRRSRRPRLASGVRLLPVEARALRQLPAQAAKARGGRLGSSAKLLDWAALVVIVDEALSDLPDDVRSVLAAQGDRIAMPETFVGRAAKRAREERQEGVPDRLGDLATAEFFSRGLGGLVGEHGKVVLLFDEGDGYEIIRKPEEVVVVSVAAFLQ